MPDACTQTDPFCILVLKLLRRLDATLDRILCKVCRWLKNQLPLEHLTEWTPPSHCSCHTLFYAADQLHTQQRDPLSERGFPEEYYFPHDNKFASTSSSP